MNDALVPTIWAVTAGQLVFPRPRRRGSGRSLLSQAEREVLRLATQGWSDGQIATRLSFATTTVKAHLSSAFAKLAAQPSEPVAELPGSVLAGTGEESTLAS